MIYGDIIEYVSREDPNFTWKKKRLIRPDILEFEVYSQKWKDIIWKHRLYLITPKEIATDGPALLWITGSAPGVLELSYGRKLVQETGAPVFVLCDVPNQPLLGGLIEDDLIAFTLKKTLETEDTDWILLYPMAKSVVRAMDVAQKFYGENYNATISGFVVTGASKRGWTTWLSACVDNRVLAIIPMVYDNLNLPAQMPNQLHVWSKYSEKLIDYTRRELPQSLRIERGKNLSRLIDPYTYAQKLTMPKIIVIATNDLYWSLNAINLYYFDLPSESCILYVPNNGHFIVDFDRVMSAMIATLLRYEGKLDFPLLSWDWQKSQKGVQLSIHATPDPKEIKLWEARPALLDFRGSRWIDSVIKKEDEVHVSFPSKGYHGVFAEIVFPIGNRELSLCTNVIILSTEGVWSGKGVFGGSG